MLCLELVAAFQPARLVAQAAYVRHWSTVIHGMQIDLATFKTEFGGD